MEFRRFEGTCDAETGHRTQQRERLSDGFDGLVGNFRAGVIRKIISNFNKVGKRSRGFDTFEHYGCCFAARCSIRA